MDPARRDFLKKTGLVIGGALVLPACYHKPVPFRFLNGNEAGCLVALCERIIPADDAPGAMDAGVIYYIDKQLNGFFKKFQPAYRQGLASVQEDCIKIWQSEFQLLPVDKQNEYLRMLESDSPELTSWKSQKASEFFDMVISHTMQGFYGAPRHGGNKNYISYRMLRIGYPQVDGQNRYKKEDGHG